MVKSRKDSEILLKCLPLILIILEMFKNGSINWSLYTFEGWNIYDSIIDFISNNLGLPINVWTSFMFFYLEYAILYLIGKVSYNFFSFIFNVFNLGREL